jgi:anti-sigma factor RsiW
MTMSAGACGQIRGKFAAYLDERLAREERQAVRRHLQECDGCRAEASAADPAFLFAFADGGAGAAEVSAEETARVLAAVRTGIELRKAERRVEGGSKRRLPRTFGFGAAASVAAAVLVAVLAGTSGGFRSGKPVPAALAVSATASSPAPQRVVGAPASVSAEVPHATGGGRVSPFAEASGPAMGQKLPADATIYDWNPGGGQPRVVWIVDRSLDI